MDILIEYLINDFHARDLPKITLRETALPQLPGKVDTVIGMRRTGKTYFLYQTMHKLLTQGVDKERLLYINFEDERLLPLTVDKLHLVTDTYYRLFPELKQQKCYLFFDEIQNINGWELFIRRLLDTENVQIALTGSSAKLLSKEIATSLRGRAITTEIFPFSFCEVLRNEAPHLAWPPKSSDQTRVWLANRIRSYLTQGGFPEIQRIDENYQTRVLQEYVDIVILRDIIERYQIPNAQALRALIRQLLSTPATLFSINKFYNDLKSQGISCTKNLLYDYLEYLHDSYLIYPVSIYTRSERVRRTNPRKIYAIDTGLINAFLHQPPSDWGRLLENFVYMELRRRGFTIEYYRTQQNTEVDFITTTMKGEQTLYQVALNLNESSTRERELTALETAMKECHIRQGYILTLDTHETIKLTAGTINILPVWHWVVYESSLNSY